MIIFFSNTQKVLIKFQTTTHTQKQNGNEVYNNRTKKKKKSIKIATIYIDQAEKNEDSDQASHNHNLQRP